MIYTSAIKEYLLEFDSKPIQYQVWSEIQFNKEEQNIVSEGVKSMFCKRAIIPIDNEPDLFISNLFIVPSPNEKFRPVINLKKLNMFVHQEHFKQETFSVVLDLVQEKDNNIIREHNKIPANQSTHAFFEEHNKIPADQTLYGFFEEYKPVYT